MTGRAGRLLWAARRGGYAIGAFNAVNLETAAAVVKAAELEAAPVILQVSENAARYAGLDLLAAVGRELRAAARVPVALHYDHAESVEGAACALELGFDGVMLETAHLPPGEGLAQLRRLRDLTTARGALLEAEFEVVEKEGRDGGGRLEPEALARLAGDCGCDALAVDVGSRHKQTEKTVRLDLDRLAAVAKRVAAPLVLHGASGVAPEDLLQAVGLGVAKVNVATELMVAFTAGVRDRLADPGLHDPRVYLGEGRERMVERARAAIRALGSAGRAEGR